MSCKVWIIGLMISSKRTWLIYFCIS